MGFKMDNISGQRDFESVLGLQQPVSNKTPTVSMYLPAVTELTETNPKPSNVMRSERVAVIY